MLTKLNTRKAVRGVASAALLCTLLFSAAVPQVSAEPGTAAIEQVTFTDAARSKAPEATEVKAALETFVAGMASGDARTVWAFASEEDQAAFETEEALYAAYSDDFRALTTARDVRIQSLREEGDTPFVKFALRDSDGSAFLADAGFWLDDAGDWKVVSLDIAPASDVVAAL